MNKKKYPFVIRMPGATDMHASIPRKPIYGIFLTATIVMTSWILSRSAIIAFISLQACAILFGIVLAPHMLATKNLILKFLASAIVGLMSIAGVIAGVGILFFLWTTWSGTGKEDYVIVASGFVLAGVFFWFSFGYAFQIFYFWRPDGDPQ